MKLTVYKTIQKWERRRKRIVNPNHITEWADIGFDEKPDEFSDVDAYLEAILPDSNQREVFLIDEFIEDLLPE
ncbi:MAG: hypothetical protein ABIH23_01550 [bacterium]